MQKARFQGAACIDLMGESLATAIERAIDQAAQGVLEAIGIDDTIRHLTEYPTVIAETQTMAQIAARALAEAKTELELAKSQIVAEIRDETNGAGKPKYSNQEARDAEFVRRSQVDEEYQTALRRYLAAEDEVAASRRAADQAVNEFAAARAVLAAQTAKVNLLAGML